MTFDIRRSKWGWSLVAYDNGRSPFGGDLVASAKDPADPFALAASYGWTV